MSVSKGRWAYSFSVGKNAEAKFKDTMELRGNVCIRSSRSDDIKKHIDFYVNDIPVDVKGNRRLKSIWLELTNVRGDKGWLRGESEYIVFDILEFSSFCFYKRSQLLDFVNNINENTDPDSDYMKFITRENRKDVIVKVHYDDIKHLELKKISYE